MDKLELDTFLELFRFAHESRRRGKDPVRARKFFMNLAGKHDRTLKHADAPQELSRKGPSASEREHLMGALQQARRRLNKTLEAAYGPNGIHVQNERGQLFRLELSDEFENGVSGKSGAELREFLESSHKEHATMESPGRPSLSETRGVTPASESLKSAIESYRGEAFDRILKTWFAYLSPLELRAPCLERRLTPTAATMEAGYKQIVPLSDFVSKEPAVVILGDPGSGKSFSTAMLARHCADGVLKGFMPVFVPLRRIPLPRTRAELLEIAAERVFATSSPVDASELASALAEASAGLLYIFDGFDGLSPDERRAIGPLIAGCVSERNRVVVTCRSYEYRGEFASMPAFTLEPLEKEQVHAYLAGVLGPPAAQADVSEQIDRDPRLSSMAQQPFFLSKMALLLNHAPDRQLPTNRGQLLNQFVESIPEFRATETSEPVDRALQNARDLCLQIIAYTQVNDQRHLGVATNSQAVWRVLEAEGFSDRTAQELLRQAYRDRLLLSPGLHAGQGGVEFSHQLIQHIYAARRLRRLLADCSNQREVENVVSAHLEYVKWDNILALTLGLLDEKTCRRVMQVLIARTPFLATICFPYQAAPGARGAAALVRLFRTDYERELEGLVRGAPDIRVPLTVLPALTAMGSDKAIRALIQLYRKTPLKARTVPVSYIAPALYGYRTDFATHTILRYLAAASTSDLLWRGLLAWMPATFHEAIPVLWERMGGGPCLRSTGEGDTKTTFSPTTPALWIAETMRRLGVTTGLELLRDGHRRFRGSAWTTLMKLVITYDLVRASNVPSIARRLARKRDLSRESLLRALAGKFAPRPSSGPATFYLDRGLPRTFRDAIVDAVLCAHCSLPVEAATRSLKAFYVQGREHDRIRLLELVNRFGCHGCARGRYLLRFAVEVLAWETSKKAVSLISGLRKEPKKLRVMTDARSKKKGVNALDALLTANESERSAAEERVLTYFRNCRRPRARLKLIQSARRQVRERQVGPVRTARLLSYGLSDPDERVFIEACGMSAEVNGMVPGRFVNRFAQFLADVLKGRGRRNVAARARRLMAAAEPLGHLSSVAVGETVAKVSRYLRGSAAAALWEAVRGVSVALREPPGQARLASAALAQAISAEGARSPAKMHPILTELAESASSSELELHSFVASATLAEVVRISGRRYLGHLTPGCQREQEVVDAAALYDCVRRTPERCAWWHPRIPDRSLASAPFRPPPEGSPLPGTVRA